MTEARTVTAKSGLLIAAVIFAWYCNSTAVILTSKWVLSKKIAKYGRVLFPFPLIITTCSNTITTVWAFLFTRRQSLSSPRLPISVIKRFVLPIGIITAFDIGCSNIALKILTVSFGTIIKGSAPVFTMLWGLAFGIETFSPPIFVSLLTISSGVGLASFGQGNHFRLWGFLLQLTATSLAGLRWAMTEKLLRGQGDPIPPLTVVLYTSPATAAFIFPFAMMIEGNKALGHLMTLSKHELLLLAGLVFVIGTLVFVLLCSEYWVVHHRSCLALSVAGVFKELLTIGGGVLVFSDRLTPLNEVGFVICQIGIGAYARLRNSAKASENRDVEEASEQNIPLTEAVNPVS